MTLKPILAAVVLMFAVSAASATSMANVGPTTVTYDETTTLGSITGSFSSSNDHYGFNWTIPDSANIISSGSTKIRVVDLPSFTLSANAGYQLSGISAFLGNLAFTELGGATTNIEVNADVSVNGGPATHVNGLLDFVITNQGSNPSYVIGYFSQTANLPGGPFSSFTVSNGSLTLSAANGTFSSIVANPQNKLEFSFTAAPVPEPETAAMLLAGLVAMGWMTQRRRNA